MIATIEEQQEKAVASQRALTAEVEDMEFRLRALSFDAVSDAKARARLVELESDLETHRRLLALAGIAIAEGERRLRVQAEERTAEQRAAWEAEYAAMVEARDRLFAAIEQHTATLAGLVTEALANSGDMLNAARRVDVPVGRPTAEIVSQYVGYHLTRAGLRLGPGLFHEVFGQPISSRGARERQAEGEGAQQ